jgi:acyl-ACP thioesterase
MKMENSGSHRQPVWEDEIRVTSYDVDCTGQLRLSSLFNYFQDTAGKHATHLGAGYEILKSLGLFWVLSRARVRIHRLPVWEDIVRLTTWPKGVDGVLFLRDFQLVSDQHGSLVDGSTGLLLLDFKTYKPHLPDALPESIPPNTRGHALEEPLRKLKPFDNLTLAYERRALATDLDVNHHVNNARYIDWLMDCYAPEETASRTVRTMQVNYVGETTFGDTVRLHKGADASRHTDYIEGVDSVRGSKVVQAVIEWGEG